MSRAFLKESTLEEPEVRPTGASALPPGARNLITAEGLSRLQEQAEALAKRRAEASARGDENDSKREVMLIDEKLRPLQRSLETAEVVPPPSGAERDRARFGAWVTVREGAEETVYRMVGVDEAEPARNEISHLSPLARALVNARVGDQVAFRLPRKTARLEVVAIRYEA